MDELCDQLEDELCEQLSFIELEQETIQMEKSSLEEVLLKGTNCLVANLQTQRPFNREAFKSTKQKIRRSTKAIQFHELGEGLMLVEFEDIKDKERVLRESLGTLTDV